MAKKPTKKRRSRRASSRGGGTLSSLRGGMKSLVGSGTHKNAIRKESLASRVVTILLLVAAVGILVYRFTR